MVEEGHGQPPSTRIKRNAACCSCRDAKVRCNPAADPEQPCQRCKKNGFACVVDKTHKRVSRRSKIDELVQEIQTIKQNVGNGDRPSAASILRESPQHLRVASPSTTSTAAQEHMPSHASSNAPVLRSPLSNTPTTALIQEAPIEPSLPRALNSRALSGEDIDHYFQKFFDHFHPYLPILRHRDPNKCYDTAPLLFWTIVFISARRYAKDDTILSFLNDAVKQEVFGTLAQGPLSLQSLNALILVCAWSFPDARFANDPSTFFSGICMNSCLSLGLHVGRGGHSEYCIGPFQSNHSHEEASFTWAGYNIISQRIASYGGLPPVGCLFNQPIQNVIDGKTPFHVPSNFRVLLECQKFCNHLTRTISACLEEARGVSAHVVRLLEDEWNAIRGLICSDRADQLDRFNSLLVQLEIQVYYMIPLPGWDSEGLKRNILRTYNTAQVVLRDILAMDQAFCFLDHIPHFYLRSALCSTCVIYKMLRSSYIQFVDREAAEQSAADALTICRKASVADDDLPSRLGRILSSWLEVGRTTPTSYWQDEPVSSIKQRMGAGIIFDCLHRWKNEHLANARLKDQQQQQQNNLHQQQQQTKQSGASQQHQSSSAESVAAGGGDAMLTDPLGSIDWSFMDDFNWDFEPSFLN